MKKILLSVLGAALLFSCTKELPAEQENRPSGTETTYRIGYEQARRIAGTIPELFGHPETKSGGREVSDGVAIVSGRASTKSGRADTLMYLFNYAGGGYAFVAADPRKGPALAFVGTGAFQPADTAGNPLSRYLFTSLTDYCEAETGETKAGREYEYDYWQKHGGLMPYAGPACDQLHPPFYYEFEEGKGLNREPGYYENRGCIATMEFSYFPKTGVDPLLTTSWGQQYPFNGRSPVMTDGNRALTGCVSTAVAQIMAYHKHPANYPPGLFLEGENIAFRETKLNVLGQTRYGEDGGPGFRDNVSVLMRVLGDLLDNIWGSSATVAVTREVPALFGRMGYGTWSARVPYNVDTVISSLENGWPVLISSIGKHSWVVDGYRMLNWGYRYYYFDSEGELDGYQLQVYPTGVPSAPYLNCNFGWDGMWNGYYHYQVFDTDRRLMDTKADFSDRLEIIPNVHP